MSVILEENVAKFVWLPIVAELEHNLRTEQMIARANNAYRFSRP